MERKAASVIMLTLLLMGTLGLGAGSTHDVAVTSVINGLTETYPTWMIDVDVTVLNNGTASINCTVAVYYFNATVTNEIGTQNVTNLAPSNSITLTFTWDLSNDWYNWDINDNANYTIKANATLDGDTNPANNEFVNGQVKIRLWGDVNGDGKVTATDMAVLKSILTRDMIGIPPLPPPPFTDLNGDGRATATDLGILKTIITKIMLELPLR